MKTLHRIVSLSRVLHWFVMGSAILLVTLAITGLIVIRTQRFRDYIRRRVVAQVETTTNGKFEFGRFYFNWERLTAEMTQVVLHGKETEGPPLVAADSVTLGLRIISLFERKIDLARVRLDHPRVHIIFYPDGSTNIPEPHRKTTWAEDVLDLAVRDYEAVDGVVEYNETRIPLRVHGESLRIRMSHDPERELYRGDISTERVQLAPLGYGPIPATLSADFTLERTRLAFPRIRISTRQSRFDAAGGLDDIRAPHGTFSLRASFSGAEAATVFKLPIDQTGSGTLDGKLSLVLAPKFDFRLSGKLVVRGAGFSRGTLRVANADVQGDLSLTLDRLALHNFDGHALGAHVAGQADLAAWRTVHFEGAVDGLGVPEAVALVTSRPIPWTGEMSGAVRVDGTLGTGSHFTSSADLLIAPVAVPTSAAISAAVPIQGEINGAWNSAAGSVSFGPSWLATASTRLDARGTPGQTLAVKLHSTNLNDLLPALALASANAPHSLPLALDRGSADLEGSLAGPLETPVFNGRVDVTNASMEGHAFSKFSSEIRASKDEIQATGMTLARGNTAVTGSVRAAARNGSFEDPAIAAQVEVRNAVLTELLREASAPVDLSGEIAGVASGTVRLSGTLRVPDATVTAEIQSPAAFGEQADRLRTTFHFTPAEIDVSSARITLQNASITLAGKYAHNAAGWNDGRAEFDVATKSLPTSRIRRLAQIQPPLAATLSGNLHGSASIAHGVPTLTALSGTFAARGVEIYHQLVGEFSAGFQTRDADLSVDLTGKLRDASIDGSGTWRLEGDEPGTATLRVPRINLATLHSLAMLGGTPAQQQSSLPFDGFVEGSATFSVPFRRPDQLAADVTLSAVQFSPKSGPPKTSTTQAVAPAQDIVLRNSGPVTLHVAADGVHIPPAQFLARDTALSVSGSVPFSATGADVVLRGNINLVILQLLNPNLLAKGNASLDATIRGAWRDPSLNGRMQLNNASLYLSDVPNGVDNVNGAIVFDRNRATIERLTAETGGGRVSFGGALEFSDTLVYRLQADAQQVRVRWPEDVSTSVDAHVELNGTPDASTLSGTVTLNRTALNPRTDLGRLMAMAARPSAAPSTSNEYLRGMQFDIRVESAPDFTLDTALTHEVQTGVDLRLRGTPLLPVVLGTVSVNAGEVQLFGNRYSIDRGDIRFLNPVKIDPILDMSLETKARGIAVNVSLSGTLQKLRVNYSSDPPLQPSEIIALLAVGRSPTQAVGITNPSAAGGTTDFSEAGGGLLGEAVSQQLSSRLQRFFGASRVKIDPTMTGVDNSPQARLTLEQQISRDITVTYITNLNYTQEQTVRVQWDFDRKWSAVAVRDANGLFGIDVQYRRRF